MEQSLNSCRKLLIICIVVVFFSCNDQPDLYKKEITFTDKKVAAAQLKKGSYRYYQGSVPQQILLDQLLDLDPDNADALRSRGIPYLMKGFAVERERLYQKMVEKDPLAWQGYRGYTYLYFYRDYERALADFNMLDILTPDVVDYPHALSVDYMRAICYLQLGNNDRALEYLDRHIAEELSTVEEKYIDLKTFIFQGIAYHNKGQYEEAAASYKRALQHAPENADLWYWLAKSSVTAGDVAAAKVAIEKADTQFKKGYFNQRHNVEEFFQIYQPDIDELKVEIGF